MGDCFHEGDIFFFLRWICYGSCWCVCYWDVACCEWIGELLADDNIWADDNIFAVAGN
jgi:hypothetical protein